ncbi:MAG TPA: hypothetical protein VJ816_00890 [Gemmatimonadales bacterium]|jgi:hypothetical protein|nr:hypothetical protein [Gemmatimonadales bacterium]
MSKWLKAVSTAMVGLLVATALAIGASAVLAAPASAMSCPNNGQSTLGWQPSAEACYQACYAVHGTDLETSHWNESTGCCSCVF